MDFTDLLAILRASDYCKPDEAKEYVMRLATEDPRTFFTLLAETMEDDEDG